MSRRIRTMTVALAAALAAAGAAYAQPGQGAPSAPAPDQGMMGRHGDMMGHGDMREMMQAHTRMMETCTEMMRTAMHQGGQQGQAPDPRR